MGSHHLDAAAQKRGRAKITRDSVYRIGEEGEQEQFVFRVCLTGGPCGGKSSSQEVLIDQLTARGYNVYFAPEVPTILMNGGCMYPGIEPGKRDQLSTFEGSIIQLQLQMERSFTEIAASTNKPSVVIFDRGLLDIPAYLPRDIWLGLLKEMNFTEEYFAERYDVVIHLDTTAHGLEEVYEKQKANNPSRKENAQEARELCDKVHKCWSSHPNVVKLANTDAGFQDKLNKGTEAVLSTIAAKKVLLRQKITKQLTKQLSNVGEAVGSEE